MRVLFAGAGFLHDRMNEPVNIRMLFEERALDIIAPDDADFLFYLFSLFSLLCASVRGCAMMLAGVLIAGSCVSRLSALQQHSFSAAMTLSLTTSSRKAAIDRRYPPGYTCEQFAERAGSAVA